MRVLITGSRHWSDWGAIAAELEGFDDDTVIVTGGARGADRMAQDVAYEMGYSVAIYQAEWDKYGRQAGPGRNQRMVDAGADLCLAFPLAGSMGTWDCVRRARAAGIPVKVVEMDV